MSREPGLPDAWRWTELAELCDGIYDCPHSTPKLSPEGPFVVRTQDIASGVFRRENAARVSAATYRERIARAEPTYGDIMYSREGAYFGVAAEVPEGTVLCLGQRMVLIRPRAEVADHRYLKYWLNSPYTLNYAQAHREGSAAPRINLPLIRSMPVLLPPLDVQRSIASCVGAIDDKIESNRRAIAISEELVHEYFVRMFSMEQDDDGVAISELIRVNPRRRLAIGTVATYVGMSSLPEFAAEIYEFESKPATSGQRFMNGDVLMARITPCLENGKTAVVDMLKPDEIGWGSTEYVVLAPVDEIRTPWIYCAVRSESIRSFAIRSMTGTSGRQRFQADSLNQYKIARPEIGALARFDSVAEPLFDRMTQLRDECLRAQELRDTLLPELLFGRLAVRPNGTVVAGART